MQLVVSSIHLEMEVSLDLFPFPCSLTCALAVHFMLNYFLLCVFFRELPDDLAIFKLSSSLSSILQIISHVSTSSYQGALSVAERDTLRSLLV